MDHFFIFLPFPVFNRSSSYVQRKTVVINAVGDVIPHIPIKQTAIAVGNFRFYFKNLRPFFQRAQLNFANLETVVYQKKNLSFFKEGWPGFFSVPTELLQVMRNTGFNIVSVANNHILDYQNKGLLETLKNLKHYNIRPIGVTKAPFRSPGLSVVVNGVRVAIVGYTTLMNMVHPFIKIYPRINYIQDGSDLKAMLVRIRALKTNHDVVIVSMHWGREYNFNSSYNKALANEISKAGADIILGHHSHVLQRVYWIKQKDRKTLVIPSMGNFLANQGEKLNSLEDYKTRVSAVFQIKIHVDLIKDLNKKKALQKKIQINWGYLPLWISNTWMLLGGQHRRISLIRPTLLLCQKKRIDAQIHTLVKQIHNKKKINKKYLYYLIQNSKKINLGYQMVIRTLGKKAILSHDCI